MLTTDEMSMDDFVNIEDLSCNAVLLQNIISRVKEQWPLKIQRPYGKLLARVSCPSAAESKLFGSIAAGSFLFGSIASRLLSAGSIAASFLLARLATTTPPKFRSSGADSGAMPERCIVYKVS